VHPKLAKGEVKGRIVPVRFTDAELKLFSKAMKSSEENTLSGWIRQTLVQTSGEPGVKSSSAKLGLWALQ